ncbi:Zinc finger CCCH-type [Penicillium bovifimosum]|uniref:PAN2-PAN3 deadenylation complex subunit PAN3 n=1 Tax=Penicillium bovifimosum TaxID=126998 RepID=A0A9W9GWF7_9EURO|nr:Zinc finger CCCH-type [Penicillium bovifimosum]KAJ5131206.1 Zinc finger CCCH-type [Penicillium bovifimosum]
MNPRRDFLLCRGPPMAPYGNIPVMPAVMPGAHRCDGPLPSPGLSELSAFEPNIHHTPGETHLSYHGPPLAPPYGSIPATPAHPRHGNPLYRGPPVAPCSSIPVMPASTHRDDGHSSTKLSALAAEFHPASTQIDPPHRNPSMGPRGHIPTGPRNYLGQHSWQPQSRSNYHRSRHGGTHHESDAPHGYPPALAWEPPRFHHRHPYIDHIANMPYQSPLQSNGNGGMPPTSAFDPFITTPNTMTPGGVGPVSANPYSHDPAAAMGGAFFANPAGFQQPVQYHLYAPIGPHNQNTMGYQRNVHDLFLPNDLREELQKKAAATLQTLPNTQLPAQVDYFHSLVPLDLSHQKNASTFGYPSWIYKAQSSKDGCFYALRRLEGFRLTNEKAIRSVQAWKRVCNGSVVTVHDAFTSRSFQDSSLIFVTDYHPLSKTLAEQHLNTGNRYPARPNAPISEQLLWGYMTQIANGLKAIHANGLAARVLEPSKILVTAKSRIRINACAILDVVQFDTQKTVADLQRQDLVNFGQLILILGTGQPAVQHNLNKALEVFGRSYSPQLKNSVMWLLGSLQKEQERNIDTFITGISSQLMSTFDSALHMDDQLNSDLCRELENGRLVRLLSKLGFVNERPEYELDQRWSETGERYFLKLFRDYVFHQVDAAGEPVVDLGHVLTCLNKLDAGTDEKIHLISRDEQSSFIVTYKELKKGFESSFQALLKPARRMH